MLQITVALNFLLDYLNRYDRQNVNNKPELCSWDAMTFSRFMNQQAALLDMREFLSQHNIRL